MGRHSTKLIPFNILSNFCLIPMSIVIITLWLIRMWTKGRQQEYFPNNFWLINPMLDIYVNTITLVNLY